jgi:NAD(P)H dehydrogenase (quinone)
VRTHCFSMREASSPFTQSANKEKTDDRCTGASGKPGGHASLKFGLPMPIATMLADSDVGPAKGDLDSQSGDLLCLIGRPTTSLIEAIRSAV